ncbi:MAG: SDR family NAD(P)-dependent oxidoreductase [Thermotogae bacterium]|nr:SDR family NAD(P)-dependent oxidoreductase [Thermotogota bacterium]
MGKVAFITGGTRGIGYAVAKAFARRGFEVFITGRRDSFGEFKYIRADVRKYEEVERAVARAVEEAGGIDVLVAGAGVAYVARVERTPLERWRELVDTNLTGVFHTVRAALPHIRDGGHIFILGSIASVRAFPGWAAYCATKFGVYGFAQALGEELKGRIKVSTVMPGAVDTDLWNGLAYVPDRSKMMKPEDVAKSIVDAYENPAWVRDILILPPWGII